MKRFTLTAATFTLTTLIAITVQGATPAATTRSAVASRSTYDPFAMARAAQARPGTAEYENFQHRQAIVKWLKEREECKVKPPKHRPHRSPVKPRDDDDDNGHGNNDDHDDDSNPGQGNGNHGTGNNGNGNGNNGNGNGNGRRPH
jgi:hypothetical protein